MMIKKGITQWKGVDADQFSESILVVLVIYKMKIGESLAFKSLTKALQLNNQSGTLFIYDNSPQPQAYERNENWKTIYRNDPANPGVSKAYNEGFLIAKSENKKWVLLADQDTEFEEDIFFKYKMGIDKNPDIQLLVPVMKDTGGIVSPFHFYLGRGFRLNRIEPGIHWLSKKKVINSGLMISLSLFEQSGGFDEQFGLDFSDLAFIQKISPHKSSFFVIDSTGRHSLSSDERHSIDETLARFQLFCQASNTFSERGGNFWVNGWKYIRAAILGLKYLDIRFITIAYTK